MRRFAAQLIALVAASFVPLSTAHGAGTPAQKCAVSKVKATGKKAAGLLKCWEKAIVLAASADPACVAKVEGKFLAAFAKAEAKGGCATTGDAAAIEAIVDAFVGYVTVDLRPPVSFATDVQAIFSANCTSCHAGAFPAGGLNLEPGQAWANLVGVPSVGVPAIDLVVGGDATNSYLFQKLTNAPGIVGVPMPFGSFPLPQATLDTIELWILQGAANN